MNTTILISSPDTELAAQLSQAAIDFGFKVVTTTTFSATGDALKTHYDLVLIDEDEKFWELAKGNENAVVLCRQGSDSVFYRTLGHKVLILPFKMKELKSVLGLSSPINGASLLIGDSHAMQKLRKEIERFAPHPHAVLIHGESGTGKELVAEELHHLSHRNGLFIPVNCSAIAEQLLEAELFGHEKGSFTGADRQRKGLFEEADGGTLFLDEVGDMPASLQVKLLRALQSGKIRRVGGTTEIAVNVRIIAASHKSLQFLMKRGEFREDLFYRLNVLPITVLPLRDRLEDIPVLVSSFLPKNMGIEEEALKLLSCQKFKGNIRQLQTIISRSGIINSGGMIKATDIMAALAMDNTVSTPLEESPAGAEKTVFELKFDCVPTLEKVKEEYFTKIHNLFPNETTRGIAKKVGVSHASIVRKNKLNGATQAIH